MIGEALKQKEGLIEELEKELAVEKTRREQMNKRFEDQMKEFAEEQSADETSSLLISAQNNNKVSYVKDEQQASRFVKKRKMRSSGGSCERAKA